MSSIFTVTFEFFSPQALTQRVIQGRSGNTAIDILTLPPTGAACAAGAEVAVALAPALGAVVAAGAVVGVALPLALEPVVGAALGAFPPLQAASTGATTPNRPIACKTRRRVTTLSVIRPVSSSGFRHSRSAAARRRLARTR